MMVPRILVYFQHKNIELFNFLTLSAPHKGDLVLHNNEVYRVTDILWRDGSTIFAKIERDYGW